ncbi:hypothetical protein Tco_0704312 [Tanacetum coccineum]|uniref:Transposase (Putative), gypsy type n=1 Tax=Tanacetum coccineum TaxID=301880 RepID=A0ABQ4Y1Q6_9ASTR
MELDGCYCFEGLVAEVSHRLPLVLRKRPMEALCPSCCLRTITSWSGLSFSPLCFAIALLGLGPYNLLSPGPKACIARLRFCYIPVLPSSSVVACASAMFPCISRHYHIHISQLSVIGAAKVSHFEILCHVHGFEPTVGLFHSLKSWNDHFFWVDAFACPASFPWNTSKIMSKDPFPRSSEFNAEHYATLVAYSAPFHKYPEPFLYLVGISRNYTLDEDTYLQFLHENRKEMDLLSFIQTADPTKVRKVRVGERQRAKDEPRSLDTTVGRVVPLLPIALAHAKSELDASVDKLFDEGGNGNQAKQGDSASGGHGVGIQLVSEAVETVVEDAAPVQLRCQRKRNKIVSDAGGPSHPPKKLREDHGTLSGASIGGKSRSTVQRLLAGVVQNAKVRGEPIPTLPFVMSSVSATPESEVDSFARPSVPLMTVATTVTSIVAPATTVKEKFVESSVFGVDSSGGGADHTAGGFSHLTCSDFIVGDDGHTCLEIVDEFTPPKFFTSIRVRMLAEYNIRERRRLSSTVEEKNSLLKAKDEELKSLKAQLLMKEAKAAEAIRLHAEASKFEVFERSLRDEVKVLKEQNAALEQEKTDLSVKVSNLATLVKVHELEASSAGLQEKVTAYEGFIDQLEKFQDEKIKKVNEKFDKLCADFVEMALHIKEKFYPRLLTTISERRWLLIHGMELTIAKCLNFTEYLSTLGAAIGKAVEKGMQEGLSARITHGAEELRANKDVSIDTIMNLLHLEDTLAERLGLTESQPHVNQLMVPIHHSSDQRVIGAYALSLSLDVSSSWGRYFRGAPGTADTTMALSIVVASTSIVRPISIDDYEVTGADDQATSK